MSGRRFAFAFGALGILALSFAPYFRPRAIAERLRQDPAKDSGFAFDSRYREFLEAVERATPPATTIAVLAPETSALYFEEAAYRLAPRRIVGKALSPEASFLAVYRPDKTPTLPQGALSVPGGFLLKR